MGLLLLFNSSTTGTGAPTSAQIVVSAFNASVTTTAAGNQSAPAGFASFVLAAYPISNAVLAQFAGINFNAFDAIVTNTTPTGAVVVPTDAAAAYSVTVSDFP